MYFPIERNGIERNDETEWHGLHDGINGILLVFFDLLSLIIFFHLICNDNLQIYGILFFSRPGICLSPKHLYLDTIMLAYLSYRSLVLDSRYSLSRCFVNTRMKFFKKSRESLSSLIIWARLGLISQAWSPSFGRVGLHSDKSHNTTVDGTLEAAW